MKISVAQDVARCEAAAAAVAAAAHWADERESGPERNRPGHLKEQP
jgi:hypothetical protein